MTDQKALYFTALGGVNEVGSNMAVIECEEESFIIDAGILFPSSDAYGLSYLTPDLNYDKLKSAKILIITHGHEDHIGAISQLLQHQPHLSVWAPAFASRLIQHKLSQKKQSAKLKINIYKPFQAISCGSLQVTPHPVNHSIPETFGLHITSSKLSLSVFYVSDFKIDTKAMYENVFDLNKLQKDAAAYKIRHLMADSTNAFLSKKTTPEVTLVDSFEKLFQHSKGNIYITFFSSNIHRMKTVLRIAQKHSKHVFLVGRSSQHYYSYARLENLLPNFSNLHFEIDRSQLSKKNNLIILSGCQAEFKSAFRRIGTGEDKWLKLDKDDIFVYSAKIIPGNERNVHRVFDSICETGAQLYTSSDLPLHSSGHASQEDLTELIQHYKPTSYTPIHGSPYLIAKHLEFVQREYPDLKTLKISNFGQLAICKYPTYSSRPVLEPQGYIGEDVKIERGAIVERRKMAHEGILFITAKEDQRGLDLKITPMGLPAIIYNQLNSLRERLHKKVRNPKDQEAWRIEARRWCKHLLGYKPQCIVHLID